MPANNEIIPQSVREAAQALLDWVGVSGMRVYGDDKPVRDLRDALAATQNTDSVPAGMVLVSAAELAELRSRMPWAGGQSPLVVKSGSAAAAATGSSDSYTPAGGGK
jgi:hypothetical protein